jgi:hypothetical protein
LSSHITDEIKLYIIIYYYNVFFAGKSEWSRPFGRPMCGWEDNIKVDLKIGWKGANWKDLTQDTDQGEALVNTVLDLQVP